MIKNTENLSVVDFVTHLRYISRLMSRVNAFDFRKIASVEKTRKELYEIFKKYETLIPEVTLADLPEFSNFLNILRHHDYENYMPFSARQAILKKT